MKFTHPKASLSYSFFSPEHNQKFTAESINLKIEKEQDNPNKLNKAYTKL
ncbi:hypothetical protein FACS189426_05120 [Bacteroidia bacterium]|nr:hypothetical protein FACS189426_05120 [Bacteroidia bacterium]